MTEDISGGHVNEVERIGDTVHRTAGPWTPTIHAFLTHVRDSGMTFVPAPLGFDSQGREVLTWIDGNVGGWPVPQWVWTEKTRVQVGQMLRFLHDASVDFDPDSPHWRSPSHEPPEVICLNDAAPYNMVHDGTRVVAFIDVDMSSPGPRVWDLAYLAYRLCGWCEDMPAPAGTTPGDRLHDLLDAYGRDVAPTSREVLATMHTRLLDLADWSDNHAVASGASELHAHAEMYRRDATRLTGQPDCGQRPW
ncbi:phosphotransferase [Demequina flava]|uniref:phosphotransferase n=1 Tax=Demequina flava TaxID=1095025 RepID=UPI0007815CFC|nr:phosphotransferase [Demequina flava]